MSEPRRSPDALLRARLKGFVAFVNILVNGKDSSDDDVSRGRSCWQAGAHLCTMAAFQDEEEKCEGHIYDETHHGNGAVVLL